MNKKLILEIVEEAESLFEDCINLQAVKLQPLKLLDKGWLIPSSECLWTKEQYLLRV